MTAQWTAVDEHSKLLSIKTNHLPAMAGIVAMFGAAREGKSTVMNQIAGCDGMFIQSCKAVACTKGSWFSPPINIAGPGENELLATLIDHEGQGDMSQEHDLKLVLPALFFATVAIYKWVGGTRRADILDKLQLFAQAAAEISPEGDEKAFGALVFLMRDTDEEGRWSFTKR